MKERKRKNKKILGLINVVVIVYIFTLVIGYSFFRESLKISGNVSTEKPKDCPFELQELTTQLYTEEQFNEGFILFNKYFAEYSSFKYNDIQVAGADEVFDNSGFNALGYAMLSYDAFPFDYYDKKRNTTSIFVSYPSLYPFDFDNTNHSNGLIHKTEYYSVMSRPLYFVFKNKTSYDLDNFIIAIDEENNAFNEHDEGNPLELFDIRWTTINDLSEIIDIITYDYEADYDSYDSFWASISGNSIFSSNLGSVASYKDGSYYLTDEFQMGMDIEFSTTPISSGEYLVLGIKFPRTLNSNYDDWTLMASLGDIDIVDTTMTQDSLAFKFWPSNFNKESAFHIRFGFDNWMDKVNYISSLGGDGSALSLEDFYNNPSSYPSFIEYWKY